MFLLFFFFYSYGYHRDLHSFPTRRSSDLVLKFHVLKLDAEVLGDGLPTGENCNVFEHGLAAVAEARGLQDRKSTRLNSSHTVISYAVFCLKKKNNTHKRTHI